MSNRTGNLDDIKLLHHNGELDAARSGYLDLLRVNPDDVDVLHLLGLLCAEQGQLDEARTYLERARKLAPQHAVLRLHLANILKTAGKYDEAERELQAVIDHDADCAPAYNNLGTVCFARGEYARAVQAYQSALNIRADYVDAYYNLGLAYTKLQQDDAALTTYRALIAIAPAHTGAHFQLGCLLMKRNQFQVAASEFAGIAETHPHHFESLANLAICQLRQGRVDQAAKCYLHALEIAPDDRDVLFNLGVIHMQQGYTRDAIQYYVRAVKAHPDFFEAHQNLGAIYVMARDNVNALLHFQESLRIRPDHEVSRHMIRILQQDKQLTTSAPAYIQSLFDSYADYYDAHMRTHLHYQVPEKLYAAVKATDVLGTSNLDIADLGAGTGLCGELFKPHARRLTGVDLSEKMLAVAAQKNIYDELVLADAEEFLAGHPAAFHLVLAGDVLVYFGELEALIAAAHSALLPQGYFAFNVEINPREDFALTPSGRFTHHQSYLKKLADQLGFEVVIMAPDALRRQQDQSVQGYLCLWRRRVIAS